VDVIPENAELQQSAKQLQSELASSWESRMTAAKELAGNENDPEKQRLSYAPLPVPRIDLSSSTSAVKLETAVPEGSLLGGCPRLAPVVTPEGVLVVKEPPAGGFVSGVAGAAGAGAEENGISPRDEEEEAEDVPTAEEPMGEDLPTARGASLEVSEPTASEPVGAP